MIAPFLAALLIAATPAETRRLPPVDRCADDASFVEFRAGLLDAVERRDADRLLASVSDDIEVSFGGYEGRAGLIELWGLDSPERSEIWNALAATLALGCMVDAEGARVSPSFFLQAGEQDDIFETWLAVVPGAPLRASPRANAPVLATLDWDVLTLVHEDEEGAEIAAPEGWYPMRLADGRRGFVEAAHARSLVDYRAYFERIDGRWRMTVFIAGD